MASRTSMMFPSECFCLVFWTRCWVVVTSAVNCQCDYFHRTRPGTTERTGWRLPNWILPSFLSCLCWLKVRAAYWMTSYCLINLAASTVSLFFQIWRSRRRATRHLSTRWSILRKWWGSEFNFNFFFHCCWLNCRCWLYIFWLSADDSKHCEDTEVL